MNIALINNDDFSVWHFRRGLIEKWIELGASVTIFTPGGEYLEKLESLGAKVEVVPMDRFISPLKDLRLTYLLYKKLSAVKFDLVHTMTIKPNVFGMIASALSRIPKRVALVSGRGILFSDSRVSFKDHLLRFIGGILLKLGFSLAHKVWFQNPDDMEYFVQRKIISNKKGLVILGSGVRLREFDSSLYTELEKNKLKEELKIPSDGHVVLMVTARLILSKGIQEFLEAGIMLAKKYSSWYFVLVSPLDKDEPDYISPEKLGNLTQANNRHVSDFRNDIPLFYSISDIVTLPSYYPEGVPRSLLEGMSFGKPLVTTDSTGCRETVKKGQNGFLIEPKSAESLKDSLELLISDSEMRETFGKNSLKIAQDEFSEESVVKRVFKDLYEVAV